MSSEIDNILNETEVGQIISKYKSLVVILVIAILFCILGYGIFRYLKSNSFEKNNLIISNFQQKVEIIKMNYITSTGKKIKTDLSKADLETLKKDYDNLKSKLDMSYIMYPAISLGEFVYSFTEDINDVFKLKFARMLFFDAYQNSSNKYAKLLTGLKLVTVNDDLQKFSDNEKIILKLINYKVTSYNGILYFYLAKSYSSQKKNILAKKNYQYVIDNAKWPDIINLARIQIRKLH